MKGLNPVKNGKRSPGATTFGCLIFLVLFVGLSYFGFKFGEVVWNYFEVKFKIREALNWAAAGKDKTEVEISKKVIVQVAEAGVQLKPRNIKIQQSKDTLTISVSWERQIEFPYYSFPLQFDVTLTEEKRWEKGPLILR
jgi:hypothetical protein